MGCLQQKNKRCSSSSSFVLPIPLFFVFVAVILLEKSMGVHLATEYSKNQQASNSSLERIHRYLRKMNKPAVKTIETPRGDIIACVDKWKQPAFDHPLLKNHKPQFPPEIPNMKQHNINNNSSKMSREWPLFDPECPEGTVPIKRITVEDVLRAKSFQDLKRKKRGNPLVGHNRTTISPNVIVNKQHEYVGVSSKPGIRLYEASATINVWTPSVENPFEMSSSQIWLIAEEEDDVATTNTIEAGWMVYPDLYKDTKTNLFVSWTADNYGKTGCHDLLCPGFVQVDKKIIVGTNISPTSTIDGEQIEIILHIYKNHTSGDWWLNSGKDGTKIGYWPADLFTTLKESAKEAQWGGVITNLKVAGLHTSTEMGSGRFSHEGLGKASYFKDVTYTDSNNYAGPPKDGIEYIVTNPSCYTLVDGYDDVFHFHFYYGGPGYNPDCRR